LAIRLFSRSPEMGTNILRSFQYMLPPYSHLQSAKVYSSMVGGGLWRLVSNNINTNSLIDLELKDWSHIFQVIIFLANHGNQEGTARGFECLHYLCNDPMLSLHVPSTVVKAITSFVSLFPFTGTKGNVDGVAFLEKGEKQETTNENTDVSSNQEDDLFPKNRYISGEMALACTDCYLAIWNKLAFLVEEESQDLQYMLLSLFQSSTAEKKISKTNRDQQSVLEEDKFAHFSSLSQETVSASATKSILYTSLTATEEWKIAWLLLFDAILAATLSEPRPQICTANLTVIGMMLNFSSTDTNLDSQKSTEEKEKESTMGPSINTQAIYNPILLTQILMNDLLPLLNSIANDEVSVVSIIKMFVPISPLTAKERKQQQLESGRNARQQKEYERNLVENAHESKIEALFQTLMLWSKPKELSLTILVKSFLLHLPLLIHFDLFHELWIKLLSVMEVYLSQDPESMFPVPSENSAENQESEPELILTTSTNLYDLFYYHHQYFSEDQKNQLVQFRTRMKETCYEHLKNILLVMSSQGVFEPGEDTIGAELWKLTWTIVDGFETCNNLKEELFGSMNLEIDPLSSHRLSAPPSPLSNTKYSSPGLYQAPVPEDLNGTL